MLFQGMAEHGEPLHDLRSIKTRAPPDTQLPPAVVHSGMSSYPPQVSADLPGRADRKIRHRRAQMSKEGRSPAMSF